MAIVETSAENWEEEVSSLAYAIAKIPPSVNRASFDSLGDSRHGKNGQTDGWMDGWP